jgi:hypothetical protein
MELPGCQGAGPGRRLSSQYARGFDERRGDREARPRPPTRRRRSGSTRLRSRYGSLGRPAEVPSVLRAARVPAWRFRPSPHCRLALRSSKIRRLGGRYRSFPSGGKEPKPVFRANLFHPCTRTGPIVYGRGPRPCEGAFILDRELDLQPFAFVIGAEVTLGSVIFFCVSFQVAFCALVVEQPIALDHVQRIRVV